MNNLDNDSFITLYENAHYKIEKGKPQNIEMFTVPGLEVAIKESFYGLENSLKVLPYSAKTKEKLAELNILYELIAESIKTDLEKMRVMEAEEQLNEFFDNGGKLNLETFCGDDDINYRTKYGLTSCMMVITDLKNKELLNEDFVEYKDGMAKICSKK